MVLATASSKRGRRRAILEAKRERSWAIGNPKRIARILKTAETPEIPNIGRLLGMARRRSRGGRALTPARSRRRNAPQSPRSPSARRAYRRAGPACASSIRTTPRGRSDGPGPGDWIDEQEELKLGQRYRHVGLRCEISPIEPRSRVVGQLRLLLSHQPQLRSKRIFPRTARACANAAVSRRWALQIGTRATPKCSTAKAS